MSKKCPQCGSENILTERRPDGFHACLECLYRWKIGESQPKQSVFDRIIASPEVLAEKLTYWQYDPEQSRCGWTNNIIVGELYKNYHEAIAATVAKLKEVCDE